MNPTRSVGVKTAVACELDKRNPLVGGGRFKYFRNIKCEGNQITAFRISKIIAIRNRKIMAFLRGRERGKREVNAEQAA